jgi:hypothetical protein
MVADAIRTARAAGATCEVLVGGDPRQTNRKDQLRHSNIITSPGPRIEA